MNILREPMTATTYERNRQNKGMAIRAKIKKRAWAHFDEGEMYAALRLLARFNAVTHSIFWGEKELSPGDFLNAYLEQRQFERTC